MSFPCVASVLRIIFNKMCTCHVRFDNGFSFRFYLVLVFDKYEGRFCGQQLID